MIALHDVTVTAGGFSAGPLDLEIESGSYGVLLGPSGAGKSLVLETVAGVRAAVGGRVHIDGRDVDGVPPERRRVGLVFQDALLFPHLSVRDNIAYGLPGRRLRRSSRRRGPVAAEIEARAVEVGVAHLLERAPASLSGGERQRVALARALAARPRALLLDEPLGAVDAESREALQDLLRRVNREDGMTMLHVTHDLAEAFAVGDRCAVLIDGILHQTGVPAEVMSRPADAAVARFLGARNLLPATRDESDPHVAVLEGGARVRVPAPLPRGAATLVLRPEQLVLTVPGDADGSARPTAPGAGAARLRGRVRRLIAQGGMTLVRVDVPPLVDVLVPAGTPERLGLTVDAEVTVEVPAGAIAVVPAT